MNKITSTEFQKAYSRLTEPHEVTALGRVIGTYFPVGSSIDSRYVDATRPGEPTRPEVTSTSGSAVISDPSFGFSRPVPKPARKK